MVSWGMMKISSKRPDSRGKERRRGIHHPAVYAGTVIVLVVIVVSFVGSPVVSNLMGPSSVVFGTFKG
ncbi:MAG: hypothetical protein LBC67_00940, partial [Spirochaetales bacterium]|nr:hypothetical protein [Spirochaetales bacterium]